MDSIHKNSFFVIADNVRSLENIGSIFRTADAFGVSKIFLCGISGTPISRRTGLPASKIAKAALGAEQWIPWEYYSNVSPLVETLKQQGVFVVALEQDSKSVSLKRFAPQFPLALVIGNEIEGVSPAVLKRADAIVEIPMQGNKESLNVAVALGVAAYAIRQEKELS